jgi:glycerophosphoryl diester phosphodiesterase
MNWNTRDGQPPLILAHRGASGLRPEHTLEGYTLALQQGADVIEPDLVPSADGVLFARHEPTLARSTDISRLAQFAARQRDGEWSSLDLSAAELDALRARQPFPGRSTAFDDQYRVPRFAAILDWAAQAAADRGRPLILYPEIKHPSEFATRGVDPVPLFIAAVQALPAHVSVWVQCFEAEPLRRVHAATGLHCALLLDADDDWRAAIAAHGGWLSRLGVNKTLLGPELLDLAHTRGLAVDAWTFRDDALGAGFAGIEYEMQAAMRLGADGLFCDFPATGIAARGAMAPLDAA